MKKLFQNSDMALERSNVSIFSIAKELQTMLAFCNDDVLNVLIVVMS